MSSASSEISLHMAINGGKLLHLLSLPFSHTEMPVLENDLAQVGKLTQLKHSIDVSDSIYT